MEPQPESSATHEPGGHGSRPERVPLDSARVQRVLDEALASQPFCHTQQCQNLLRYIVRHSLAQSDHLLRERVIGAEVFGRRPDYDTGEDPVVRIRAAEVRKRLAQFYQATATSPAPPDVLIEIPSGSYLAVFTVRDLPSAATPSSEPQTIEPRPWDRTEPSASSPAALVPSTPLLFPFHNESTLTAATAQRRSPRRLAWLTIAAVLLIAAAASFFLRESPTQKTFHAFWSPWLGSGKTIISVGSNAVYLLPPGFVDNYAREHNLEARGRDFYVPSDALTPITGNTLVPAYNSFVALGDVASISNIVAALTSQHQTFQERFPEDISFAELRSHPTVLVGGFNNPMTIELTKNLPFILDAHNEIEDRRTPGRRWVLQESRSSLASEDYAIISRIVQADGNSPMMSVAGIGQYGTLAASQFVCNPDTIEKLDHTLPRGWAKRNLQLVLHVRVVDFKPDTTEVIAFSSW